MKFCWFYFIFTEPDLNSQETLDADIVHTDALLCWHAAHLISIANLHLSGKIRPFFHKKFLVNLAGGLENLESVPTIASDMRIKKTTCFKKTIEEEKRPFSKKDQ